MHYSVPCSKCGCLNDIAFDICYSCSAVLPLFDFSTLPDEDLKILSEFWVDKTQFLTYEYRFNINNVEPVLQLEHDALHRYAKKFQSEVDKRYSKNYREGTWNSFHDKLQNLTSQMKHIFNENRKQQLEEQRNKTKNESSHDLLCPMCGAKLKFIIKDATSN